MRLLVLLLVGALAAAEPGVEAFLRGDDARKPALSTPEEIAAALPLIDAALRAGGAARVRACGLIDAFGPAAAPLVAENLVAYRDLPPAEQRLSAETVTTLRPLAERMLVDGILSERPPGMDWGEALRLAPDPAPLLPRLLCELNGEDRLAVIAAAHGLASIPWCPAARAGAAQLEAALARFAALPPRGPDPEFMVLSGWSEADDPDSAVATGGSGQRFSAADAWPTVLTALSRLAPDSSRAVAAALAHLDAATEPRRRQAALLALTHLRSGLTESDLATRVAPWLGHGPRGRMALAVLARCPTASAAVLARLPAERCAEITGALLRRPPRDHRLPPLSESWVDLLSAPARSRSGLLLASCGAAGVERCLAPSASTTSHSSRGAACRCQRASRSDSPTWR